MLKIVFGLEEIVVLGHSTRPTTKESFPFGDFFSRTFFAYIHLCSVVFVFTQVITK